MLLKANFIGNLPFPWDEKASPLPAAMNIIIKTFCLCFIFDTDTDTVFISFRFAAKAELHEWGQY